MTSSNHATQEEVEEVMTAEEKLAAEERREYESASPEERKGYNHVYFIRSKHPERPTSSIKIRLQLHRAGDHAAIFWRRIEEGMSLRTATNLLYVCEKVWAVKTKKERAEQPFDEVVRERLRRYDSEGTLRMSVNGKSYRTSSSPIARAARVAKGEAVPGSPLRGGAGSVREKKNAVREAIGAWVAARLPKDDPRAPAFAEQFMREVEAMIESLSQRFKYTKPSRDDLFSACALLNIPRPKWGKPADAERAWKNRRAVLRSTHPDHLHHDGGLDAYHAINEAYAAVVAYNDSLVPSNTSQTPIGEP